MWLALDLWIIFLMVINRLTSFWGLHGANTVLGIGFGFGFIFATLAYLISSWRKLVTYEWYQIRVYWIYYRLLKMEINFWVRQFVKSLKTSLSIKFRSFFVLNSLYFFYGNITNYTNKKCECKKSGVLWKKSTWATFERNLKFDSIQMSV